MELLYVLAGHVCWGEDLEARLAELGDRLVNSRK